MSTDESGYAFINRKELIEDICKVRQVLISLVTEKPYDSGKGFALSHVSDIHRDLVQVLCMLDDNSRSNEAFGSELNSLVEMKKSLMESLSGIVETVESDKSGYVEEVVTKDEV